ISTGITTGLRPVSALCILLFSVVLLWLTPPQYTVVAAAQDAAVTYAQAGHTQAPATAEEHTGHTAAPGSPQANVMMVSPERLQTIGVKFEIAQRRRLDRTIRTVGQVEIDERRLASVNIKLEGWIDDLFVNSTGEHVQKGQKLFTLYSP